MNFSIEFLVAAFYLSAFALVGAVEFWVYLIQEGEALAPVGRILRRLKGFGKPFGTCARCFTFWASVGALIAANVYLRLPLYSVALYPFVCNYFLHLISKK